MRGSASATPVRRLNRADKRKQAGKVSARALACVRHRAAIARRRCVHRAGRPGGVFHRTLVARFWRRCGFRLVARVLFFFLLFHERPDVLFAFAALGARAGGFPCFGISTARLSHTLGDAVTRFTLLGRTHTLYFHNPLRQYYMMRNRIALYRRRYIPLAWKLQDIPRAVVKTLLFALVVRPRRENARYLLKGIIDGYLSRLGPLPE